MARDSCQAGNGPRCWGTSQKLQDVVWDKLEAEAAKLHQPGIQRRLLVPQDGDGLHVRLPACAAGNGTQGGPEFFYRHVTKIAGYNIITNLRTFTGVKVLDHEADRNFRPEDYALLAEAKRERPNATVSFTFARDPIARFVSGYAELEQLNHTWLNESLPRGSPERAVEFIRTLLRGYRNYHIVPQVQFHIFHYQLSGAPFDFIGRLEDFRGGWYHLENITGCLGRLPAWKDHLGWHRSRDDARASMWGLLSSDRAALRTVCLLFIVDFHILSYPLPEGCKDFDAWGGAAA